MGTPQDEVKDGVNTRLSRRRRTPGTRRRGAKNSGEVHAGGAGVARVGLGASRNIKANPLEDKESYPMGGEESAMN